MSPKIKPPSVDSQVYIVQERSINAQGYGHISKYVMCDRNLDLGAKSLYAYLCSYAGKGNDDGHANLRRSRILEEQGICEEAYLKYMAALEKREYIIRTQTRAKHGGTFSVVVVEFIMIPSHIAKEIEEVTIAKNVQSLFGGTLFVLGYGSMPKIVAKDSSISNKARGFYAYHATFANTNGDAFPSREKCLYDLNISKNSYTKYIKELSGRGYITAIRERDKKTGQMTNTTFKLNAFPQKELERRSAEEAATKKTDVLEFPQQEAASSKISDNTDFTEISAATPKKPGTVELLESGASPKKPGTVKTSENQGTGPKKPGTVESITQNPSPQKPCPVKPGAAIYNTNTILGQIPNSFIDRLMDTVREQMDYKVMQFTYVDDPMALEALESLLKAIATTLISSNSRVQIGGESIYRKNVCEVLMTVNNSATIAVIERYLARADTVNNVGNYLLTSLYNELLKQQAQPMHAEEG